MLPWGNAGPRRAGRGPRPGVREDEAASGDVGTGRRGAEPVLPSIRLSYRRGGAHSRPSRGCCRPCAAVPGRGPACVFCPYYGSETGRGRERWRGTGRGRGAGGREGRREEKEKKRQHRFLPTGSKTESSAWREDAEKWVGWAARPLRRPVRPARRRPDPQGREAGGGARGWGAGGFMGTGRQCGETRTFRTGWDGTAT